MPHRAARQQARAAGGATRKDYIRIMIQCVNSAGHVAGPRACPQTRAAMRGGRARPPRGVRNCGPCVAGDGAGCDARREGAHLGRQTGGGLGPACARRGPGKRVAQPAVFGATPVLYRRHQFGPGPLHPRGLRPARRRPKNRRRLRAILQASMSCVWQYAHLRRCHGNWSCAHGYPALVAITPCPRRTCRHGCRRLIDPSKGKGRTSRQHFTSFVTRPPMIHSTT